MRVLGIAAAVGLALAAPAAAQVADLVDHSAFRVCADPGDKPLSAQDGSGFENKIAELFAAKLGVPLQYTWFPQVTGFVRQTLQAGKCDVVMGYAQGDDLVLNTNHYYTSTHVIVVKADGDLADVDTLSDPRLKGRRIGVVAGSPPATHVARLGMMADAEPYELMTDRRVEDPAGDMLRDLEFGQDRRGAALGADRRAAGEAGPSRPEGDAAPEGDLAAAARLPHHHGRPAGRGRVEAPAEQPHPPQPARDRRHPPRRGRADPRRLRQGQQAGVRVGEGAARFLLQEVSEHSLALEEQAHARIEQQRPVDLEEARVRQAVGLEVDPGVPGS